MDLTEEELAFYDILSREEGIFKNEDEIKNIAREVIKKLGYYVRVVDWNKKDVLRAKIRTAIKKILIDVVDGRIVYEKIDKITSEIYMHAEELFAGAQ